MHWRLWSLPLSMHPVRYAVWRALYTNSCCITLHRTAEQDSCLPLWQILQMMTEITECHCFPIHHHHNTVTPAHSPDPPFRVLLRNSRLLLSFPASLRHWFLHRLRRFPFPADTYTPRSPQAAISEQLRLLSPGSWAAPRPPTSSCPAALGRPSPAQTPAPCRSLGHTHPQLSVTAPSFPSLLRLLPPGWNSATAWGVILNLQQTDLGMRNCNSKSLRESTHNRTPLPQLHGAESAFPTHMLFLLVMVLLS